jgi:pSer/pThr/pTyr-binding forkhead associated (FHA) protein
MPLNVKLVVVGGDVKTTELSLRLPATIGRGRGQSVVLPHPLVSRQHCELFEADGQLMVRDLGSLNGTFVNNQKVDEAPLPPGELLTVGTVTFRAVYETEEVPAGSADTLRKAGPSDKTIPAAKAPTIRATPKAQPAPAESDSAVLEFDFGDEKEAAKEPVAASPQHPTERLEGTLTDERRSSANEPNGSKPAAKKPAVTKPAVTKPVDEESESIKVTLPGDDEEEEPASSSSDDDLNDFLKSLDI